MAKRDPTADAIARLAALKQENDPASLAEGLTALLKDKSVYVVGRAADVAADRDMRAVLPQIIDAFAKLLAAPASKDVGCSAKLALAKALVKLEAGFDAEGSVIAGTRHVHWEASWGGPNDLAGVIAIEPADGLALAERFLEGDDDAALVEAALLAIGGSRRPASYVALHRHAQTLLLGEHRETFISAVAMTRQDAAITYLLSLVVEADRATSKLAVEALTPLRPLQRIGERLDQALAART